MKKIICARNGRCAVALLLKLLMLLMLLMGCALLCATVGGIVHDYPPLNSPTSASVRSVAVVLGAKSQGLTMSNVLRSRVDESIALYQSGQVQAVVFTGGYRDKNPQIDASESALARAYAIAHGVPSDMIWMDERSVDTWGNLTQAGALVQQNGWTRVLLVSDRWHLARAQMMANDLGMVTVAAPVRESVYRSDAAQLGFILREVVKIWAYALGWK